MMKIIIIGGSIGGLCAGIALLDAGFDVEIYERSAGDLKDRGAGLVIQPDMIDYFIEKHISSEKLFGVPAKRRQVIDDNGEPSLVYPNDTTFTSWNYIWRQLRDFFPSTKYFSDFELESITIEQHPVVATFTNGETRTADLVIGADGFNSVVRKSIFPEVRPLYAGYVAIRGLIPESQLTPEEVAFFSDKFSIYPYKESHFLCYLVPGTNGELSEGKRLYNWVWYLNKTVQELEILMTDKDGQRRESSVPAGYLSTASHEELNLLAKAQLPKVLYDRVLQTDNPFVQVILDMSVPKMYKGQIALLGDAAFLVRPHTASGTAKAYRDAITLAMSLQEFGSIEQALYYWNEHQTRHATALIVHGMQLAERSELGKNSSE